MKGSNNRNILFLNSEDHYVKYYWPSSLYNLSTANASYIFYIPFYVFWYNYVIYLEIKLKSEEQKFLSGEQPTEIIVTRITGLNSIEYSLNIYYKKSSDTSYFTSCSALATGFLWSNLFIELFFLWKITHTRYVNLFYSFISKCMDILGHEQDSSPDVDYKYLLNISTVPEQIPFLE